MKKLVIFDLDGTLLNTIADLAAATNQALQYYGYPTHETEAYRFFVGNGINKFFVCVLFFFVFCLKGNVRKRMY